MDSQWKTVEKKIRIPKPLQENVSITSNKNDNYSKNISHEKPDIVKVKEITIEFRNALQKARVSKNLNRKQLAQLINEKQNIIDGLENGTITPNPQVINKLSKVLNTKLPQLKTKILIDERYSY